MKAGGGGSPTPVTAMVVDGWWVFPAAVTTYQVGFTFLEFLIFFGLGFYVGVILVKKNVGGGTAAGAMATDVVVDLVQFYPARFNFICLI
ncbi:hypothetical protein HanIR_Chr03g0107121 [Helianthus annuus]|nr:hypothetical protein HanIR_Chr03g0107121 [Helianthus annuus]